MVATNNELFLFDESTEIKLKLQLFYIGHGVRTSAVIDAAIKYEDGCVALYTEEVFTCRDHNEGLSFFFMKDFGKSDYRVKEASIDDKAINLKIDEKLMFKSLYIEKGKRCISMELKHVLFSYEGIPHS